MRKSALGMSVAIFSGLALAACGNEPEPIAPVDPSFDRTLETTDDDQDAILPGTTVPEADTPPASGSEPGEIPEIMEGDTFGADEPRGEAADEMMEDPDGTDNPM